MDAIFPESVRFQSLCAGLKAILYLVEIARWKCQSVNHTGIYFDFIYLIIYLFFFTINRMSNRIPARDRSKKVIWSYYPRVYTGAPPLAKKHEDAG